MERVEKFSEIEKFEKNPFIGDNGYQVMVKQRGFVGGTIERLMLDPETGVTSPLKVFGCYKNVDSESFVKIFKNRISSLFELTKTGNKVLAYVMSQLEVNRAEVYIHLPDLMEYADWDQSRMAYRGLTELYNAGIISPSNRPRIFFVNPDVLFNGNRVAFVEEYRIREVGEQKVEDPLPLVKKARENEEDEVMGQYRRAE